MTPGACGVVRTHVEEPAGSCKVRPTPVIPTHGHFMRRANDETSEKASDCVKIPNKGKIMHEQVRVSHSLNAFSHQKFTARSHSFTDFTVTLIFYMMTCHTFNSLSHFQHLSISCCTL